MLHSDISVEVRDKDLARVASIDPGILDLKAVKRHLKRSAWTLKLPSEVEATQYLAEPGSGIIISVRGTTFMSGPMISPSKRRTNKDPSGFQTFSGEADDKLLWSALALPDVANEPDAQTLSHDVRTGPAETVMKQFVHYNLGAGALLSRRGRMAQHLVIDTDLGTGPSVSRSVRFDNLGTLLNGIAVYAGMGFEIVQVDSDLVFRTFAISDRSAFVRFDMENGTLEEEQVQISSPKLTRVYILGQGEGAARQVIPRTSVVAAAAEEAWGYVIEETRDQRQTSDVDELEQAGDEILEDGGFTATAIKAIPSDDFTMRFKDDWGLGDIVTAVVAGEEKPTNITEVSLVAGSSGAMIGIAIGDVTEFETDTASESRAEKTEQRVSALERNAEPAPDTGWTAVTFASGYVDYEAGYECQVRRVGKVVYARGLFKPTTGTFTAGATISPVLTVPDGFRPTGQPNQFFPAFAGSAAMYTAGLSLSSAGIMGLRTGPVSTPAFIALDGLNWLVD